MKRSMLPTTFIIPALLYLPFHQVVHAYIDPGTGSIVLQAVIGGFAAVLVAIGMFWKQIKAFVGNLFHRSKPESPAKDYDVTGNAAGSGPRLQSGEDYGEIRSMIHETEAVLTQAMDDAVRAHDSQWISVLKFLREALSDLSRSVESGTIARGQAKESILELRERVDGLRNQPRTESATAKPTSEDDLPYLVLGVDRNADGYAILGISRSSSKEDVDRAFKQKQLGWHPDKFPSPDDKRLANAVSVILNNAKDQIYGQMGWK